MASFELFKLFKFKKISILYIYIYTFFLLKCIMCDKKYHFMERKTNILHQIMA